MTSLSWPAVLVTLGRMEAPVPLGTRFNGKQTSGRVRGSSAWFTVLGYPVRPDHLAWVPLAVLGWLNIRLLINPLSDGTGPRTTDARVVQLAIALAMMLACMGGIIFVVGRAARRSTVRFARFLAVSELVPGMWIESPNVRGEYAGVRRCQRPPDETLVAGCAVVALSDLTTIVTPVGDDLRDVVAVYQIRDEAGRWWPESVVVASVGQSTTPWS